MASTLSSDIDMSATMICHMAWPSVLRGRRSPSPLAVPPRAPRPAGVRRGGADLAVELPAHPEQQDAAGEKQADDLHELHREQRQEDAQHDRAGDPVEDHLLANGARGAGRGHADHDGVVARQDDVDEDHLQDRADVDERSIRSPPAAVP